MSELMVLGFVVEAEYHQFAHWNSLLSSWRGWCAGAHEVDSDPVHRLMPAMPRLSVLAARMQVFEPLAQHVFESAGVTRFVGEAVLRLHHRTALVVDSDHAVFLGGPPLGCVGHHRLAAPHQRKDEDAQADHEGEYDDGENGDRHDGPVS